MSSACLNLFPSRNEASSEMKHMLFVSQNCENSSLKPEVEALLRAAELLCSLLSALECRPFVLQAT